MMNSALRKMGNSTGLIVPRALLAEIGVEVGVAMDLKVENGRLIATPVVSARRGGWAAAAKVVADDASADEWQDFGNESDAEFVW